MNREQEAVLEAIRRHGAMPQHEVSTAAFRLAKMAHSSVALAILNDAMKRLLESRTVEAFERGGVAMVRQTAAATRKAS